MPSASTVRLQIEQILQERIPSALTPRPAGIRESIPTGIPALDSLTHGGFPIGAMTELVGPDCSGRTTAALSFIATVTGRGSVCAWIDVADALDPEAAAANGVDFRHLLWVRCSQGPDSVADRVEVAQPEVVLTPAALPVSVPVRGGGSPHPRSEGRGMPEAIDDLLTAQPGSAALQPRRKDRRIGTPGAPNRPLMSRNQQLREREEQVSTDRLPARRGENLQPAPGPNPALLPVVQRTPAQSFSSRQNQSGATKWSALDRALRSADLLLQAGGFQAIVLDLGSTPAEQAWRIPMATWFRFRAACERSRVCFLLLTQHPCARSSAELVLRMGVGAHVSQGTVMTGMEFRCEIDREGQHRPKSFSTGRPEVVAIRKPVQRVQAATSGEWNVPVPWMRA